MSGRRTLPPLSPGIAVATVPMPPQRDQINDLSHIDLFFAFQVTTTGMEMRI
jgi:hypothetical protein